MTKLGSPELKTQLCFGSFPKTFLMMICAAVILPVLTACAVNPATGGPNLVLMSESREKEIGAEEHAKVLASQPVYQDADLLAYVTEVGNRIAAVSHRPDLGYTYTIIDSPSINAMALRRWLCVCESWPADFHEYRSAIGGSGCP